MAEGLNRVTLIGNLGADPELKYTQNGQGVLRLRLATTESYMNRAGERQQRTDWHTCIVWGKRGEALNNILSKGRSICVEGRIQYRQWEDKDGINCINCCFIVKPCPPRRFLVCLRLFLCFLLVLRFLCLRRFLFVFLFLFPPHLLVL